MLVVVVAVFGVCWLPLHAFMLVVDTPGAAPDRRQNLHARRRLQPAADRLQDARAEAILHRHLLLRPLAGHVQQFRRRGRPESVARGVSGAEAALRHGRLVVPVRSGWT